MHSAKLRLTPTVTLGFAHNLHLGVCRIHEVIIGIRLTNVVEKQLFADASDRRDFSREGYRHGGHPVTGLDLGLGGLNESGDAVRHSDGEGSRL